MERQWDMKQVSDGKKYHAMDMLRIGCQDCNGCSACCQDSGDTILLDPWDMYHLEIALQMTPDELFANQYIALGVVDGLVLPHLFLENKGRCPLLNESGRCAIHQHRPGICRLFPLGRIYEENSFSYFLQIHECIHPGKRTKVRIHNWLGIPEWKTYEDYIIQWHYFLKKIQNVLETRENEETGFSKSVSMFLLKEFYLHQYEGQKEFYEQFFLRKDAACRFFEYQYGISFP